LRVGGGFGGDFLRRDGSLELFDFGLEIFDLRGGFFGGSEEGFLGFEVLVVFGEATGSIWTTLGTTSSSSSSKSGISCTVLSPSPL